MYWRVLRENTNLSLLCSHPLFLLKRSHTLLHAHKGSPIVLFVRRDQPNQLQPSLISFPSLSYSQPISLSSTPWILPMSWSTKITSMWWFLIDTTPSLKSLTYSTPSPILHSPYPSRIRVMDVSRSTTHTIHFTNATDIREILSLEGRMIILFSSFYRSNSVQWGIFLRLLSILM